MEAWKTQGGNGKPPADEQIDVSAAVAASNAHGKPKSAGQLKAEREQQAQKDAAAAKRAAAFRAAEEANGWSMAGEKGKIKNTARTRDNGGLKGARDW